VSPRGRALFLDRDGVINRALVREGRPYPPASVSEIEILPGVERALQRAAELGLAIIVVTNQPDIARGTQTAAAVNEIHAYLRERLPIDDILVCEHDDTDQCDCRKPLPGLITRAAVRYHLNLAQSYLVGDRWRDIDAGAAAGCTTILIDYGYQERTPENPPDVRVFSLEQAVAWIERGTTIEVHQ
jgi:D-glycero-D-manno-heptose 1,7-bisphosphate phosphatase